MSLDMDDDAYERHYQSNGFPRLRMIQKCGPRSGDPLQRQRVEVKFLVDFLECEDEMAVLRALNGPPVPLTRVNNMH